MVDVMIDRYSFCAVPVECISCTGEVIGHASGFLYEYRKELYLVSNWHVLSGRNPKTGQPRHSSGAIPEKVSIPLLKTEEIGQWKRVNIDLVNEMQNSWWLHHPIYGQGVDVAVLKLPPLPDFVEPVAINEAEQSLGMSVSIGQDVFCLGFPMGLKRQVELPVWKRGSIASEPHLNLDPDLPPDQQKPCILIDTATREGMSGSPVLIRKDGGYNTVKGEYVGGTGVFSKLIGVYSGRHLGEELTDMQLGIVWKAELIHEIIEGAVKGTFEMT